MRDLRALGTAGALFYIFLWASAYVPSKIGVIDSSPLWFLVVRFATAGVLLVLIARVRGDRYPATRRMWAIAVLLGVLSNALYLGLTYEALRRLSSGVGAIVASLNPLVLALVAPFVLSESLGLRKVGGLALGFGGVVAIMIVRTGSGTARPADVALAFGGVIASVGGTLVFKRWCTASDPIPLAAVQFVAASAVLLPFAVALEGRPHAVLALPIIVSFMYLVCVISVGASLLWFWLLRHGEASRVSAYYFLTPVFGLALAALLVHEQTGVRDLGGLAMIAIGIALVARG